MSKKKKKLDLGGFELCVDKNSEHKSIRICAKSKIWATVVRDDNIMFSKIAMVAKEKELRDYLKTIIQMQYMLCNITPDIKFVEDFLKAYTEWHERDAALLEQVKKDNEELSLVDENANEDIETMKVLNEMLAEIDEEEKTDNSKD